MYDVTRYSITIKSYPFRDEGTQIITRLLNIQIYLFSKYAVVTINDNLQHGVHDTYI